jgi:polyketide cyclase/dehydrase/lipid transport protein
VDYTVEIDIALPRDEVARLFADPDNLVKWQRGLQSIEPLSGEPGKPGSTSRLVFLNGKRRLEMVETITANDLPEAFHGTYDAKGVHNVVENWFSEPAPGTTRWVSRNVFEFQGFMKVIGLVFKGSFPKQSRKYLEDFKAFAEGGADVRD